VGRSVSKTVPISARALEQRLNRLLALKGKQLHKARGIFAVRSVGNYFIVADGVVVSDHQDLEKLAREMNALEPYERLME
jgi:hypothetical protein